MLLEIKANLRGIFRGTRSKRIKVGTELELECVCSPVFEIAMKRKQLGTFVCFARLHCTQAFFNILKKYCSYSLVFEFITNTFMVYLKLYEKVNYKMSLCFPVISFCLVQPFTSNIFQSLLCQLRSCPVLQDHHQCCFSQTSLRLSQISAFPICVGHCRSCIQS